MYLKRIVAERFGRIDSVALGDLAPGLTVVLGPNEAGKTSFTSLVRHVLYGYPRKGSEPGYESDAGKRLGRLVFAEDEGEWAIERAEGPRGGPVVVNTLVGPARLDLHTEIADGISREAFRVVFGFGLDEMAQIESGRGEGLDILSRLSAARVGLGVSPADVRAALLDRMSKLWLKGGSNPRLNELKSAVETAKKRLAELEAQAGEYARDRDELFRAAARLGEVRGLRDATGARARDLEAAVREFADLSARIDELGETIGVERAEAAAAREALSFIEVDEEIIARAAEMRALLEELSGFKQRLARAGELEPRIEQVRVEALRALGEAAVGEDAAMAADLGPETTAGFERWRDRLAGLESQRVTSLRAAEVAADSASATRAAGDGSRERAAWVPGVVLVALGAGIAVWGAIGADYVQAVLGALVLGVGVAFLVRARGGVVMDAQPGRSAAAASARAAADRDADALEGALIEWRAWLSARGLDGAGEDPAAVAILLAACKRYREATLQAADLASAREVEVRECEAYRARLAVVAGPVAPDIGDAPLEEVAFRAARLRERIEATLAAQAERQEQAARLERVERTLGEAEDKQARAREKAEGLLAARGLGGADGARLRAEHNLAAEEAHMASEEYDEAMRGHTALEARLDGEGRDSEMARLRLELAGLEERRAAALERYAVLAIAERLMADAQQFNERTRQPAVIKRAGEVFATITDGRYVRVVVPFEGGEFLVYDAESQSTPTSKLSTGAAQQLYLALRIALIESLDEMGPGLPVLMDDVFANFDPERKLGAARAVAELASHRQVVMFTCHPETAELFARVAPGHAVVALARR